MDFVKDYHNHDSLLLLQRATISRTSWHNRKDDVRRFADAVYRNLSSPLRWDKKDWATTAIVLGTTAAISLLDQPVNRYLEGEQDPFLDVANKVGYWYGSPYSGMILTGGFYLTGLVFKNEWARETGLVLGTAFTTSTLMGGTIAWFSASETVRHLSTNQFKKLRKTYVSVVPNFGRLTLKICFN